MFDFPTINELPLFMFLGYAEIHYHLKFLYPGYYRREPEIIADVPSRCIREITAELPVLIIIKDAHLFPVHLNEIKVDIAGREKRKTYIFKLQQEISVNYFPRIFQCELAEFDCETNLEIMVTFHYSIRGKNKTAINDNYRDWKKQPFICYYAARKLPFPSGWFAGEPHCHSIHTSDQVEFGADLESTRIMAEAMGLSWFFVTDHSYDLDDREDDYTRNDPQLPIWEKMRQNCRKADSEHCRVLPGEEISIGNANGRNVHLLAIDHPDFISGSGDSAEKWFRNKPQHQLAEIRHLFSDSNLFIAAHPGEKVPLLQKITLRRGNWKSADYEDSGICFLQMVNSAEPAAIQNSISAWTKLLLKGKKYFILAGNDAHGNFNLMRQIKIPFIRLFSSRKQIFGKFFTAFQFTANAPLAGIKSGKLIISNGPFLNFELQSETKKLPIGSTLPAGRLKLFFEVATSEEFGKIEEIRLHLGTYSPAGEKMISHPQNGTYLDLKQAGYLRMSLLTANGGLAFTNPVWIE